MIKSLFLVWKETGDALQLFSCSDVTFCLHDFILLAFPAVVL